jgi:hypothetical protein
MSCRDTHGGSGLLTWYTARSPFTSSQVSSLLHDETARMARDLENASDDQLRNVSYAYRSTLDGAVRNYEDTPEEERREAFGTRHQRMIENLRAGHDETPPEVERQAALSTLGGRLANAENQLDGYIDNLQRAVRGASPHPIALSTDRMRDEYTHFRRQAVDDRSLRAPREFVSGLRNGAFTWGIPRDRPTAYALHKLAEEYADFQVMGPTGQRPGRTPRTATPEPPLADPNAEQTRCDTCGQFAGPRHYCPRHPGGYRMDAEPEAVRNQILDQLNQGVVAPRVTVVAPVMFGDTDLSALRDALDSDDADEFEFEGLEEELSEHLQFQVLTGPGMVNVDFIPGDGERVLLTFALDFDNPAATDMPAYITCPHCSNGYYGTTNPDTGLAEDPCTQCSYNPSVGDATEDFDLSEAEALTPSDSAAAANPWMQGRCPDCGQFMPRDGACRCTGSVLIISRLPLPTLYVCQGCGNEYQDRAAALMETHNCENHYEHPSQDSLELGIAAQAHHGVIDENERQIRMYMASGLNRDDAETAVQHDQDNAEAAAAERAHALLDLPPPIREVTAPPEVLTAARTAFNEATTDFTGSAANLLAADGAAITVLPVITPAQRGTAEIVFRNAEIVLAEAVANERKNLADIVDAETDYGNTFRLVNSGAVIEVSGGATYSDWNFPAAQSALLDSPEFLPDTLTRDQAQTVLDDINSLGRLSYMRAGALREYGVEARDHATISPADRFLSVEVDEDRRWQQHGSDERVADRVAWLGGATATAAHDLVHRHQDFLATNPSPAARLETFAKLHSALSQVRRLRTLNQTRLIQDIADPQAQVPRTIREDATVYTPSASRKWDEVQMGAAVAHMVRQRHPEWNASGVQELTENYLDVASVAWRVRDSQAAGIDVSTVSQQTRKPPRLRWNDET